MTVNLNNATGTGLNEYAYYSKYLLAKPGDCEGFKDCQQTFEYWRINRFRIRVQPGYNAYNQTYNTVNLDALAAMQIWTASDPSANETMSGTTIQSYNNAKVHTLSLNGIKTIVNTQVRINLDTTKPQTILPPTAWLNTFEDMSTAKYSGAQVFMRMNGITATNYMPVVQLILEYDCEFKLPAFQNRPSTFETEFVGSKLLVIPDGSQPDSTREYVVVGYTLDSSGNNVRLERADGQPGSLDYNQEEFWEVYYNRTSGKYFSNRSADYTGPTPRKPAGWQPAASLTN